MSLRRDDWAEVGIGTMIVFIASILVASIAAGVLIASSQKLQAKSTQTGNDATRNVSSGLQVIDVDGVLSVPERTPSTSQTGNDATRNVSSGLQVIDVDGVRSGTDNSDPVDELEIWVTLGAGADPVDLS